MPGRNSVENGVGQKATPPMIRNIRSIWSGTPTTGTRAEFYKIWKMLDKQ